ncbi:hypothetical protein pdam_00018283, partial [Pocillopora damicornis]
VARFSHHRDIPLATRRPLPFQNTYTTTDTARFGAKSSLSIVIPCVTNFDLTPYNESAGIVELKTQRHGHSLSRKATIGDPCKSELPQEDFLE